MWSIIFIFIFQTHTQRNIKPCKNGLEKSTQQLIFDICEITKKTIMAGSDIQEDWEATHV
jgi:hypothetical protein